jgi:DNA-binding MarR family transcriptional regulator
MTKKQTILDEIDGYPAWLAVARTAQLCHRSLASALEPLDLEVAHYDVLANVARDEGLSQQVLARRLLVAKSNVSALLTVLERRGLAQRTRHQTDARVRLVSLTPEGRRVAQRAMKIHAGIVSAMLNALTAAETQAVGAAMVKIAAILEPPSAPVANILADAEA